MPQDLSNTVRNRKRTNAKVQVSSSAQTKSGKTKHDAQYYSLGYPLMVATMALVISYFHFYYIYQLFEGDKHFSHLSTLERELSFRTEMGLYYSYFKQIAIESPSFLQGFLSTLSDNRTEAPTTINVLERFNLYPEVLLSVIYRAMNSMNMLKEECFQVNRGSTMSPVLSCEGHKEPTYFYVTGVFMLNGALLGILFLFGTFLSKSLLGGVLTTLAYLFNHDEATRVMWTPPLRESFSYPFHGLQLLVVTCILQQDSFSIHAEALKWFTVPTKKHDLSSIGKIQADSTSHRRKMRLMMMLCGSTVLYMLPWQLAQFTLATQLLSLGLLFIVDLLPFDRFFFIICTQVLSFTITAVLMFANRMLLTSLFSTTLFSFCLLCLSDHSLAPQLPSSFQLYRWLIIARRSILFLVSFVATNFVIKHVLFPSADDDAHIWDILKSKLIPTFRTFDTQLYTCAKEFDFIDKETIIKLCRTGLLPLSVLIVGRLAFDFVHDLFVRGTTETNRISNHYHLIQTGVYSLMGVLIMRLKLFSVPQLCLLTSLVMHEQLWPKRITAFRHWKIVVFSVIVLGMSVQGQKNIREQLNIKGEYSNYPMEKMVDWINLNTRNASIFAGTMPTMANLKLSTGRSIAVHPHYEHAKIRRRVKLTYTMFSRKPLQSVHSILKELHVDYYVYESHWCTITNRPTGCSFPEMYDLDEQDERIRQRTILACQTLQSQPQPYFKRLFTYDYLSIYAVL